MLRRMPTAQFAEWRLFADLEPFGEERADLRASAIISALYNIFTRKKGDSLHTIAEFKLPFGDATQPQRTQTVAQQKSILMRIALAHSVKGK